MTLTVTRTRTHTFTTLANPFLVCRYCRRGVAAYHDGERCGCNSEGPGANAPCGHAAGTESVCPSWSPVNGCRCGSTFGEIDHPSVRDLGTRPVRR